jgi:hypothetical protein
VSNLISGLEPAANARTRSARGIALPSAVVITQPRMGMLACPRTAWDADAFGYRLPAAGLNVALGQRKPDPAKQYAHTTRVAAASGGGEGPHPAREPT